MKLKLITRGVAPVNHDNDKANHTSGGDVVEVVNKDQVIKKELVEDDDDRDLALAHVSESTPSPSTPSPFVQVIITYYFTLCLVL